jgi:hypothetical protein
MVEVVSLCGDSNFPHLILQGSGAHPLTLQGGDIHQALRRPHSSGGRGSDAIAFSDISSSSRNGSARALMRAVHATGVYGEGP